MEEELRQRILEKIKDLEDKVITKEKHPESEQSINTLYEIEEGLDNILSMWYY